MIPSYRRSEIIQIGLENRIFFYISLLSTRKKNKTLDNNSLYYLINTEVHNNRLTATRIIFFFHNYNLLSFFFFLSRSNRNRLTCRNRNTLFTTYLIFSSFPLLYLLQGNQMPHRRCCCSLLRFHRIPFHALSQTLLLHLY